MDQQPPDPRLGLVLQERYRIIDRVGEGAMAVVYRGERIALGKQVAVKFLHPWVAAQPQFRVRFETEARAMSRLNHPNCVSVIDFGFEGAPFVVMDFVAGRTLRSLMVEQGPLEPGRAIAIMKQILAGLGHAHAQGIVHRDIKPENMMLVAGEGLEDHVRILDFGLAKLHDGPAMTAGFAVGTPSYMSPEQTGGPGEIDLRTDIYAAGVVLFELLTGRKPFLSENVAEIFLMHRETPAPTLHDVRPQADISPEMERVVGQALAKFPEDRFASAAAFVAALDATPESRTGRGYASVAARQSSLKTEVDPSLGARVMAHLAEEKKRNAPVAVSESGALIELQEVDGTQVQVAPSRPSSAEEIAKTTLTPLAAVAEAAAAPGGLPAPPLPSGAPTRSKPVPAPAKVAAKNASPPTGGEAASARGRRVAAAILVVFFLFAGLSLVAVVRNGRAGFAAARQQQAASHPAATATNPTKTEAPAHAEAREAPAAAPAPAPAVAEESKAAGAAFPSREKTTAHKASAKSPSSARSPHAQQPTRHQETSFFRR